MPSIRQLYVTLSLKADDYNNKIREAQKEAREFNNTIKPVTRALDDVGKTATAAGGLLTAGITIPLAAMSTLSVKAASDFESSFAGVRKTVDATEAEFAKLSQGFRDMASEIPVSVNELNRVGEAAGQLGIKKEDILQFTRTMADLGVTTNLTADEAATATAQIQNIFGAAGKDVDRFGATLVALGNAGASTEKDIINMGLRIAGAGQQVGLSQAQVLSFASALSSVGINAEAGGSAISRVLLKINDAVKGGGDKLDEFARIAGMNSAAFKKAFETDAAGATTAFISGLNRLKNEGENVNATLEGVVGKNIILKDTLMRAAGAGDMLSQTIRLGNEAWQENSALTNEAAERYKTFESTLTVFWNRINNVAITIGQILLPILTSMLSALSPVIDAVALAAEWFAKLPISVQTVVVVLGILAAAIGPVLLAIGAVATGLAVMVPAVVSVTAVVIALAPEIIAIAGTLATWVAVLGTVATAISVFIANHDTLRTSIVDAWERIRDGVGGVMEQLLVLFQEGANAALAIWQEWGPEIMAVLNFIGDALAVSVGIFATTVETGLKVITGIIQAFHGLVTGDFKTFSAGWQTIWSALWDAVKAVGNAAITLVKGSITAFHAAIITAFSSFKSSVEAIWTALWNAIKNAVTAPLNAVKDTVSGFTTAVINKFKDMYDAVVGNSFVPDMIAGIRSSFGELGDAMVTPAQDATDKVTGFFNTMFDRVIAGFKDWKAAVKDFAMDFVDQMGGVGGIINSLRTGDFGSFLDGLKGVVGLGDSASQASGRTGSAGGSGSDGNNGRPLKIGPVEADPVQLVEDVIQAWGKGRRTADALVPAQEGFVRALAAIIDPQTAARAAGTLDLQESIRRQAQFEQTTSEFMERLEAFAMADTEGKSQLVVNQSLKDLTPLITQIRLDLQKDIDSLGGAALAATEATSELTGDMSAGFERFGKAVDQFAKAVQEFAKGGIALVKDGVASIAESTTQLVSDLTQAASSAISAVSESAMNAPASSEQASATAAVIGDIMGNVRTVEQWQADVAATIAESSGEWLSQSRMANQNLATEVTDAIAGPTDDWLTQSRAANQGMQAFLTTTTAQIDAIINRIQTQKTAPQLATSASGVIGDITGRIHTVEQWQADAAETIAQSSGNWLAQSRMATPGMGTPQPGTVTEVTNAPVISPIFKYEISITAADPREAERILMARLADNQDMTLDKMTGMIKANWNSVGPQPA